MLVMQLQGATTGQAACVRWRWPGSCSCPTQPPMGHNIVFSPHGGRDALAKHPALRLVVAPTSGSSLGKCLTGASGPRRDWCAVRVGHLRWTSRAQSLAARALRMPCSAHLAAPSKPNARSTAPGEAATMLQLWDATASSSKTQRPKPSRPSMQ